MTSIRGDPRRGSSAQGGVKRRDPFTIALDRKRGGLLASAPREFGAQVRVIDDRCYRPRDIIGVVRVDKQSRIACNLRQGGFARRHDRRAQHHGFENGKPEAFVQRRKDDSARPADQGDQEGRSDVAEAAHAPLAPQLVVFDSPRLPVAQLVKPRGFSLVMPASAAAVHQSDAHARRQIGLDETPDVLLRLKGPKKQQVLLKFQTEGPGKLLGNRFFGPLQVFLRKSNGLVRICYLFLIYRKKFDDITL